MLAVYLSHESVSAMGTGTVAVLSTSALKNAV